VTAHCNQPVFASNLGDDHSTLLVNNYVPNYLDSIRSLSDIKDHMACLQHTW